MGPLVPHPRPVQCGELLTNRPPTRTLTDRCRTASHILSPPSTSATNLPTWSFSMSNQTLQPAYGQNCRNVWNTCETHSLPARVGNACWNGSVAASADKPHAKDSEGTRNHLASGKKCGHLAQRTHPCLSPIRAMVGDVDNSSPGAAPRLALRKFRQNTSSSKSKDLRGIMVISSGGRGSRGATGRRSERIQRGPVTWPCGFQYLAWHLCRLLCAVFFYGCVPSSRLRLTLQWNLR